MPDGQNFIERVRTGDTLLCLFVSCICSALQQILHQYKKQRPEPRAVDHNDVYALKKEHWIRVESVKPKKKEKN
jgi:hypothetical protein